MIAGKTKKLALARKRLQPLTPAELTQVSGGNGPMNWDHNRRHHHDRHHHHHRGNHFRFPFFV
jgi:hypothetical protein